MVTLECLVVGVGCEFTVEVSEDVAALRTSLHTAIVKDCNQQFDVCALKLYVAKLGDKCLSSTAVRHLKRGKIPTFMASILLQGNLTNLSELIDSQPRVKQHTDRVDVLVVVPDNIETLLRPISFNRKMQKYRGEYRYCFFKKNCLY
ncbi:hypothetical protein PR003_g8883 [Phytophthora rubi]|uniref:Uncharacterized protein n=1 Tax=Phytophthora rubi TaxID=129364 RepID=A0A6A3MVW7_9STRA|nr:hypothetical protein PR002_g8134 [Phytophthora rubi]KAE9037285.1 hypothetical protein PR001_g8446 [Phytophthora rubi]KAE9343641.1 hypothetical protein PR003_g8883 [Phytophthora rubi]